MPTAKKAMLNKPDACTNAVAGNYAKAQFLCDFPEIGNKLNWTRASPSYDSENNYISK